MIKFDINLSTTAKTLAFGVALATTGVLPLTAQDFVARFPAGNDEVRSNASQDYINSFRKPFASSQRGRSSEPTEAVALTGRNYIESFSTQPAHVEQTAGAPITSEALALPYTLKAR